MSEQSGVAVTQCGFCGHELREVDGEVLHPWEVQNE